MRVGPKPVNVFKHGGHNRTMLTIEIDRRISRGATMFDCSLVLDFVHRWLRENGVSESTKVSSPTATEAQQ